MNNEILNEIDYKHEIKAMKEKGELDEWVAEQVYRMCLRFNKNEDKIKKNTSDIIKLTIAVAVLAFGAGGGAYGIISYIL